MGHTVRSATYISLTTFKRTGQPVATPVWVAPALPGVPFRPGELCFVTLADSWKVKRLRRDPRVEVTVCDMRGRIEPGTPRYAGTARLLESPEEVRAVKRAIGNKYGAWYHAFAAAERVIARVYPWYGTRAGIAMVLEETPVADDVVDAQGGRSTR
ncbi:MAG: PPOX class F420-dependent oxidoreductase [Actinomycetia bacterium]|nr:PPOX class F420-dependent oxidoreductase [Actinomycetes bacterium]